MSLSCVCCCKSLSAVRQQCWALALFPELRQWLIWRGHAGYEDFSLFSFPPLITRQNVTREKIMSRTRSLDIYCSEKECPGFNRWAQLYLLFTTKVKGIVHPLMNILNIKIQLLTLMLFQTRKTFGTQIKIFLMKSGRFLSLHRHQHNWHVQGTER